MEIIWTRHAAERQKEWEKRLGITRQEVEVLLEKPEQVLPGDAGALVAQARRVRACCVCPSSRWRKAERY